MKAKRPQKPELQRRSEVAGYIYEHLHILHALSKDAHWPEMVYFIEMALNEAADHK